MNDPGHIDWYPTAEVPSGGNANGGNVLLPLVAAAGPDYTDLLLLIAECLVPLAFDVSPDGGRRQARLEAIAKAYREDTDAE